MAINRIDNVFPQGVEAFFTDRIGGVSQGPYGGFNVGAHVGDVPSRVAYNRVLLEIQGGLPQQPRWLNQVHGTKVQTDTTHFDCADAAVSTQPNEPLAIMTADCLPVLFASKDGLLVAAAHAGWRGLAAGVLEATIEQMAVPASDIVAWLGPCIGPRAFEVGGEVKAAFSKEDAPAFTAKGEKYLADLQQLAANRLARLGIENIHRQADCTFSQSEHYFSYRREQVTGRMAFVICRKI
ncbi:peptidoglycan editing factor PgeF [Gallaecimonas mangrovi]|uniref:peptidoglycan editing factor PgeF n=1 Tax=Gallaecimonas mangrovi TaxID=2291597 RepID=UPI000E206990|nr:peptidoglycan editing factor PgeF [Gallaecimonas mangrovi]